MGKHYAPAESDWLLDCVAFCGSPLRRASPGCMAEHISLMAAPHATSAGLASVLGAGMTPKNALQAAAVAAV